MSPKRVSATNSRRPRKGKPGRSADTGDGDVFSGSIRVLLIDDNPGDVEIVRATLAASRTLAFEVESESTLAAGLRQLERRPPDVVLLDLSLPDSASESTLAAFRAGSGAIPIIVITGHDDEELALRILRDGADGYLSKADVKTSVLVRMLWHAIERQEMIASLEESIAREHQSATHDLMTGLPNRVSYIERLNRQLRVAQKASDAVAVLYVDLDRFRYVNERFGHSDGDDFLRLATDRISACLRADETFCRIGGDEFCVVIRGFRNDVDPARVATRILKAFEGAISRDGRSFAMTVSIGIAVFPQDGDDAETLTASAEAALYHAKRFGGARYEFYRPELNASATERLELELDLRAAVRKNQLVVFYQPKVDYGRMEWRGSEALVRWIHPERGLVPPGKFIPVAEEVGLIGEIGDWVLGAACRQGRIWQDAGSPALPVSVNVSAHQFENDGFPDQVLAHLEASGLAPDRLELEITESVLMNDLDRVRGVIERLRAHGVLFSIDDFGTGYSSLSVLRSLPVNTLKVDRSFVSRVAEDEKDAGLAQAIVALAHGLGLDTIAEGVETVEQATLLSSLGCDQLQGFLFSQPLPSQDLDPLITDRTVRLEKETR